MKNIYIIPTDKPSRLVIDTIENKLYYQPILHDKTVNALPQNIYITNDEEIREGDWFLEDTIESLIFQRRNSKFYSLPDSSKKIILTTDQDLNKDGVQKIDDEFLEWFVKNPSCEEVEVDYKITSFIEVTHPSDKISTQYIKKLYKIIIPKEEPCDNCNNKVCCCIIRTQETIEDAFKKTYLGQRLFFDSNEGKSFEQGAKWQAKRMYSEEEVIQAFEDGMNNVNYDDFHVTTKQWFEQFKKK